MADDVVILDPVPEPTADEVRGRAINDSWYWGSRMCRAINHRSVMDALHACRNVHAATGGTKQFLLYRATGLVTAIESAFENDEQFPEWCEIARQEIIDERTPNEDDVE